MLTRRAIIDYIAPETDLFPCDHALLFGSRHAQAELARECMRLFAEGYFEAVVVSGGRTSGSSIPEAVEIAAALVQTGLPRGRILLEPLARNTGENVFFSRKLLPSARNLLLLGKIYAKRRYAMTVRRQWPEIQELCCHGLNYFAVPRNRWWCDSGLRSRVIAECRKIPAYLDRGYLQEIEVRGRSIS